MHELVVSPFLGDYVVGAASLAGAHALAGDIDTAVTIGHEAIDAVTAVSSARTVDKLRTLHTVARTHAHQPRRGRVARAAGHRHRRIATAA